jgi:hypothetical protein
MGRWDFAYGNAQRSVTEEAEVALLQVMERSSIKLLAEQSSLVKFSLL